MPAISLLNGQDTLVKKIMKMETPTGIMPKNLQGIFNKKHTFIYKDPKQWNEFFIFNQNITLLLLSVQPLYFLEIRSRNLNSNLYREYQQVKRGKTGVNKSLQSLNQLHSIGEHDIGIYFTPQELSINQNGYIQQRNTQQRHVDLFRLIEAAKEIFVFSPKFTDIHFYNMMRNASINKNYTRVIYTKITEPEFLFPIHHLKTDMHFSIIIGKRLELNDSLSKVIPSYLNSRSDTKKYTRDFIAFLSIPLHTTYSNSKRVHAVKKQDGIMILIQGNIQNILDNLKGENIILEKKSNFIFYPIHSRIISKNQIRIRFSLPVNKTVIQPHNYCIAEHKYPRCTPTNKIPIYRIAVKDAYTIQLHISSLESHKAYYIVLSHPQSQYSRNTFKSVTSVVAGKLLFRKIQFNRNQSYFDAIVTQAGTLRHIAIYNQNNLIYLFTSSHIFQKGDTLTFYSKGMQINSTTSLQHHHLYENISNKGAEISIQDPLGITIDYIPWQEFRDRQDKWLQGSRDRIQSHIQQKNWSSPNKTLSKNDIINSHLQECIVRRYTTKYQDTNKRNDWHTC